MRRRLKAGKIDRSWKRPAASCGDATQRRSYRDRVLQRSSGVHALRPVPTAALPAGQRRDGECGATGDQPALKGASIFWRAENAERMLHMRAYYKAGRWAELMLRVMYRSPYGKPARCHEDRRMTANFAGLLPDRPDVRGLREGRVRRLAPGGGGGALRCWTRRLRAGRRRLTPSKRRFRLPGGPQGQLLVEGGGGIRRTLGHA